MRTLTTFSLCLLAGSTFAQQLFAPSGSVGSTTSGNQNVGIGTNSPNHRLVTTATSSMTGAAQFFTNSGNGTQSVQVLDGWGNPAVRFNNDGTSFEIRGTSSFLELLKEGKPSYTGFRLMWDNTNDYGVSSIGNSIFNSSQTNLFRLFVDNGVKTDFLNANKMSIGTLTPQALLEIENTAPTGLDPLFRITGFGQDKLVQLRDNTAATIPGLYSKYGLWLDRKFNENTCGAFVVGTATGVHASTDQVDNVSQAFAMRADAGKSRTIMSNSIFTGIDVASVKANTCYGVTSVAGSTEMGFCSSTSYAGRFFAHGNTAIGIYATAQQCGDMSGDRWAGLFDGKTLVKERLEIDGLTPNTAGLKFQQLNYLSPVSSSLNGKLLSVDNNGNVVLVPAPGGGGYWSPNGNNIYNNNGGNVGIGTNTPMGKFSVSANSQYGLTSVNAFTTNTIGSSPFGVFAQAANSLGIGYGGSFEGGNTGVYGFVSKNLDGLTPLQDGSILYDIKGIDGFAENLGSASTRSAIGVRGIGLASNTPNALAIGLYGLGDAGDPSNSWALYADGRAYSVSGTWTSSDARLKKNVVDLNSALDMVLRLSPKTYEYRDDGKFASKNFIKGKTFGFLAQDLEQVMPQAVTEAPMIFNNTDKNPDNDVVETYKAVNYTLLIPVLTQAIKEQQVQIEDLKKQIAQTKSVSQPSDMGNINLDTDIRLFQNEPNPFSIETNIGYFLPETVQNARMLVFDLQGKQIKTYQLDKKGNAQLTIKGSELQAGMYVYALVADGKMIDTKRMILTEE